MIDKIKKWFCCAYKVLRKGVRNMIRAMKARLSGEPAKAKRVSPIRFLRNLPGGGAWREGDKKVLTIIFVCGVALGMPASMLVFSLSWSAGILAVLLMIFLFLVLIFAWGDDIQKYFLGSRGERAVADSIAHFTRTNWRVFHDFKIPRKNWNIDHIVVCPKGVICIETKTMQRYKGETKKLRFDGKRICWGESSDWDELPWDPVEKIRRYTEQLKEFLREKNIQLDNDSVMPMVVYPGWEFADDSVDNGKIIVGNRKKISSLVSLEEDEVKLSDRKIIDIAEVLKPKEEFPIDDE